MKNFKYIFSILLLAGLSTFISCKDDSDTEPTPLELQLEALQNGGSNWVLANDGVQKDGYDVTSQFPGFALTIGNKTYNTQNGTDPVWPASGTWDFQNDNPNLILRDDGTSITISLSGNTMTLTFMANGINSGGRVDAVSGEYQFHLVSE